ncbi:MAG TPA: hypothetical protein VF638_00985 [Sphingomonas sp.]|jgi:hypothetical protein
MPDIQEGQTATNPKTGQKIVYKGGQWHSAAADPSAPAPAPRLSAAESKAQVALSAKLRGAMSVERQLRDIRSQYDKNFKGVGPASLLEYLPTQQRKQFDATANGMRPLLKPLVRDPGEGAFTDADQALLDSLIPDGGKMDSENEQRFRNIEGMISDARRNAVKAPPAGRMGQFKVIR